MPTPRYDRELSTAVAAVREAAELCQAVQAQLGAGVLEKDDRSPVTVADYGSQAVVCRVLAQAFPDDPVIAEEDAAALRAQPALTEQVVQHIRNVRPERGPDTDAEAVWGWIDHGGAQQYSPRFWTLDPIDGTKGFLRSEQYAVALALVVEGRVVVAALACPNLPVELEGQEHPGGIFAAVRGEGAVCMPLAHEGTEVPIRASETAEAREARFCESVESGHSSHGHAAQIAARLGLTSPPVRMDSQAKYAVVARGEADLYLRLPTRSGYVEKIWDHAAGALLVEEAGGRVTDVEGRRLDFSHGARLETNRGVVVSNGVLHDETLAAVRAVLAPAG